jgi:hypothetical protein
MWPGKSCLKTEQIVENKNVGEAVHVQAIKAYGEVKIYFHPFLTLALNGRVSVTQRPL